MKFVLEITCDNAAFDPDMPENEVVRIVEELMKDLGQCGVGGRYTLYDHNGNVVGFARFEEN